MRKSLVALIAVGFATAATACASKGYVNTEVGKANSKVDTLGTSLEEAQERTRQNEQKIGAVDSKAQAAGTAADQAQRAAMAADSKATAAGSAAQTAVDAAVLADAKATAVDLASKRILYTVVLSEDEGGFKFNSALLPADAKARIDAMITGIKADPKGSHFEIEGHTDNVGSKGVNTRIGVERAEMVKRYLYDQHQVPLHKMNVISYGQEKPVAPNTTKVGRAQNRRVVIRVLA
jgi:outer membrane protein OmpA-like peptidoglycan-associated protein